MRFHQYTTYDEVLAAISAHVSNRAGWKGVKSEIKDGVLTISCPEQQLLIYDLTAGREIYGRIRFYFDYADMAYLEEWLKEH